MDHRLEYQGVKRVVVCVPVKKKGALNVVMGVNQHLFDPVQHRIVTAASCTANCLAPVVKVIHENLVVGFVAAALTLLGRKKAVVRTEHH